MATIKAKGHEFEMFVVKDSSSRRALQFRNAILQSLKKLGLTENQSDIPMERFVLRKCPASATWFFNGHRLYYSYEGALNFVENLYVVSKVIEFEVDAVVDSHKPIEDFVSLFSEDKDVEDQRKEARKVLGIAENSKDLDEINKRYKELARAHHPDKPTGNPEKFKEVNRAHKILKRELE